MYSQDQEVSDDSWISQEYIKYYENIKTYIGNLSEGDGLRNFTPHDSNHCFAVEKIVKELISKSCVKLNNLEKFILLSAVWTHDLGMFEKFAKKFCGGLSLTEQREKHDETSALCLKEFSRDIFGLKNGTETVEDIDEAKRVERYINTINIISKYHRKKEEIIKCPEDRFIENIKIRARLLACFLRLGDTLHVDLSRFNRKIYNILRFGNFDRISRLHWLKSAVVSNVYLDAKKGKIYISIDVPEPKPLDDYGILEEGYKKLSFIIKENIYEDIIEVKETFREYDLTYYTSVEPIINYVAGYNEEEAEELQGVINDIELILSPNNSKIIQKTFDSINSLCNLKPNMINSDYELFYKQTEQLIENLKKILKDRPCHVGLNKIILKMDEIFPSKFSRDFKNANVDTIITSQKVIKKEIEELAKNWETRPYSDYKSHLESKKHIFVCGFSEMVSNFLTSYNEPYTNFKDNVNIYVLEFGGKRRFSYNNVVEYNDGLYYALHLRKLGFKNVNLLPDTSFPSLLADENMKINSGNSLTLFGANGIDKKYFFSFKKIPGDDESQLKKYLQEIIKADWVEQATFENIDDNKIKLSKDKNSLILSLNKNKNKIELICDLVSVNKFMVRTENEEIFFSDVGHSSGHLMAAIISKYFGIDVKVIANEFKLGPIDWNLSGARTGKWFTGQKNILKELESNNIKLINYLEDKIPNKLIDEIIIK